MAGLPDDYFEALELLARAGARHRRETGLRVVIVGGAAAAFHTQGAILSGDFDIVADIGFETALLAEGFRREDRAGRMLRGYYHPRLPRLGFELVSGALFDGRSGRDRCLRVIIRSGVEVIFPAVEDMIADRLGQFAANQGDPAMLHQARLLFHLASSIDEAYLSRRVAEEGGDLACLGDDGDG